MENQVQVMATLVAELDETTCEVDRWDDLSGLIEDILSRTSHNSKTPDE